LMLTGIVQGPRDKPDVRQLADIDVRHPITARAQIGKRPSRPSKDFRSPEHSTRAGDCGVPEPDLLTLAWVNLKFHCLKVLPLFSALKIALTRRSLVHNSMASRQLLVEAWLRMISSKSWNVWLRMLSSRWCRYRAWL